MSIIPAWKPPFIWLLHSLEQHGFFFFPCLPNKHGRNRPPVWARCISLVYFSFFAVWFWFQVNVLSWFFAVDINTNLLRVRYHMFSLKIPVQLCSFQILASTDQLIIYLWLRIHLHPAMFTVWLFFYCPRSLPFSFLLFC